MSGTTVIPEALRGGRLRAYLLMGVVLIVARVVASRMLLVYDDAFITFTYSRNLAAGHGFVYFPGEAVLGTTAPLFGIICSLFYLLHLPMPGAAVGFNILLDTFVLFLTIAAMPRERRPLAGVVFTVLFAVSPIVSRVTVGAMETSLYLASSLSALTLFVRGRRRAAFVVASLCYFLRPEALLLLAILAYRQIRRGRGGETVRLALLSLLCLAIPFIALYLTYGQILPQSVVAKSGGGTTLIRLLKQFVAPDPLMTALLLPAAWGVVVVLRTKVDGVFSKVALAWGFLYLLAYAAARPHVWSWYGVPVYYGVILAAAYGLADAAVRIRADGLVARWAPGLVVTPVVFWLGLAAVKGTTPSEQVVRDNIEAWCANTITDPATTVAASDIGVIGYYSRARVYDLVGLVWPPATGYDSWAAAVNDKRPDYLFLNAAGYTVDMMRDPGLAAGYEPLVRFSRNPAAPLDLEAAPLPRGWAPDYIVYRRVDPATR